MKNDFNPGDAVNAKIGESVLGHTVVSVGSTHAILRRGDVSRRVPLEDISVPPNVSGAAEENAAGTNSTSAAASDVPTRADFSALENLWKEFAECAGKRLDVIEAANAGIGSLTQSVIELRQLITALADRVTALEEKPEPLSVARTVSRNSTEDTSANNVGQSSAAPTGDAAKP